MFCSEIQSCAPLAFKIEQDFQFWSEHLPLQVSDLWCGFWLGFFQCFTIPDLSYLHMLEKHFPFSCGWLTYISFLLSSFPLVSIIVKSCYACCSIVSFPFNPQGKACFCRCKSCYLFMGISSTCYHSVLWVLYKYYQVPTAGNILLKISKMLWLENWNERLERTLQPQDN